MSIMMELNKLINTLTIVRVSLKAKGNWADVSGETELIGQSNP